MDKHPDMLAAYEAAAAMIAKAKADGKFLGIQIPPMPEEDLKLPSLLRFVLEYLPNYRLSPLKTGTGVTPQFYLNHKDAETDNSLKYLNYQIGSFSSPLLVAFPPEAKDEGEGGNRMMVKYVNGHAEYVARLIYDHWLAKVLVAAFKVNWRQAVTEEEMLDIDGRLHRFSQRQTPSYLLNGNEPDKTEEYKEKIQSGEYRAWGRTKVNLTGNGAVEVFKATLINGEVHKKSKYLTVTQIRSGDHIVIKGSVSSISIMGTGNARKAIPNDTAWSIYIAKHTATSRGAGNVPLVDNPAEYSDEENGSGTGQKRPAEDAPADADGGAGAAGPAARVPRTD